MPVCVASTSCVRTATSDYVTGSRRTSLDCSVHSGKFVPVARNRQLQQSRLSRQVSKIEEDVADPESKLISHAAVALEKARSHAVEDDSFRGNTKDHEIRVKHSPDAETISIIGSGIGLFKVDLIKNLGAVAKPGTTNFLEAMTDGSDSSGQFVDRVSTGRHYYGHAPR